MAQGHKKRQLHKKKVIPKQISDKILVVNNF